jgi:hypothetical protein
LWVAGGGNKERELSNGCVRSERERESGGGARVEEEEEGAIGALFFERRRCRRVVGRVPALERDSSHQGEREPNQSFMLVFHSCCCYYC